MLLPLKGFDSASIVKEIRHFVLPADNKLEKSKPYLITANLSGSKYYLSYTRTLIVADDEEISFSRTTSQKIKAKPCKANKKFEQAVKESR